MAEGLFKIEKGVTIRVSVPPVLVATCELVIMAGSGSIIICGAMRVSGIVIENISTANLRYDYNSWYGPTRKGQHHPKPT